MLFVSILILLWFYFAALSTALQKEYIKTAVPNLGQREAYWLTGSSSGITTSRCSSALESASKKKMLDVGVFFAVLFGMVRTVKRDGTGGFEPQNRVVTETVNIKFLSCFFVLSLSLPDFSTHRLMQTDRPEPKGFSACAHAPNLTIPAQCSNAGYRDRRSWICFENFFQRLLDRSHSVNHHNYPPSLRELNYRRCFLEVQTNRAELSNN